MALFLYRNYRLLVLLVVLIVVGGLGGWFIVPRTEDPPLSDRSFLITTFYPGASAERVEALITKKIEEELTELDELESVNSFSSDEASVIYIEVNDEIGDPQVVGPVIRDRINDLERELPPGVVGPRVEDKVSETYSVLVGITWNADSPPVESVLNRLAKNLEDELRLVPGTEYLQLYGSNEEQVRIELDGARLASMGLSIEDVARQLRRSDAKISAGQINNAESSLLLQIEGEFDSVRRVEEIIVAEGEGGMLVRLGQIARVTKGVVDPPRQQAFVAGKPAMVIGAKCYPGYRADLWTSDVKDVLEEFGRNLPPGLRVEMLFQQLTYTNARLSSLYTSFGWGLALVFLSLLFMMGWRSSLIISAMLPLSILFVLAGMRFMGMGIHQTSVGGMIIALGLLIDNPIIMVDELRQQLGSGKTTQAAIEGALRHLRLPLLGSTLTTMFAFVPITLLPGNLGEYIRPLGYTVILALAGSLFLSLTIVPALVGWLHDFHGDKMSAHWWSRGFSSMRLIQAMGNVIDFVLRRPRFATLVLPLVAFIGFALAPTLEEQFFPPADRDQFHIRLHMPAHASFAQTREQALEVYDFLMEQPRVESVQWFVGRSAPSFYYNVIGLVEDDPRFAQAIVKIGGIDGYFEFIRELQTKLDLEFPNVQLIALQLEQGVPVQAPIEVRIDGPELDTLYDLGEKVRAELAAIPAVIHTRSTLEDGRPRLIFRMNEEEAQLASMRNVDVAAQMNAFLSGARGGSVLESTEELDVSVRLTADYREAIAGLRSIDLQRPAGGEGPGGGGDWIPITALGEFDVVPQKVAIPRHDGRRANTVLGFISSGVLPSTVMEKFRNRLEQSDLELPAGYNLVFEGEAAERNTAIRQLMASIGLIAVLMASTLIMAIRSFRLSILIAVIGLLSLGFGIAGLWLFDFPLGFMAILGGLGLFGIAINDTIVVLAAIRGSALSRAGDSVVVRNEVLRSTRHVVSTTMTTVLGFMPLVLSGGGLWPPVGVMIGAGVIGATGLALLLAPAAYMIFFGEKRGEAGSV